MAVFLSNLGVWPGEPLGGADSCRAEARPPLPQRWNSFPSC